MDEQEFGGDVKKQKLEPSLLSLIDDAITRRDQRELTMTAVDLEKATFEFDEEIRLSLHSGIYQNLLKNPASRRDSSMYSNTNITIFALSRNHFELAIVLDILEYGNLINRGLARIPDCSTALGKIIGIANGEGSNARISWDKEEDFIEALFSCNPIQDIVGFLKLASKFVKNEDTQDTYEKCIKGCKHYLKKRDVAFLTEVKNNMPRLEMTKNLLMFIADNAKNEKGVPDKAIIALFTNGMDWIDVLHLLF